MNVKHALAFHLKDPFDRIVPKHANALMWGPKYAKDEVESTVHEVLSDELYGLYFMILGTVIWAWGNYPMHWLGTE